MGFIGISLYAEDVNALTDMVAGPPCALSLSLHARAVLGNLGLPELRRIVVGISDLRSDVYPIRCGINYTYKGEPNPPIFDEGRVSARFQIVWDVPGILSESLSDIRAEVGSLPFVGGRVRQDRHLECTVLTDKEIPGFLSGHFLSLDQQFFARRILREICGMGETVDMRDLFRAVSWRHFWKREDAEKLMQQMAHEDGGTPFPRDHPLMQWVDNHPHMLRFLPVGYRQLGKPMVGRLGARETLTEIPHVYAETVYGLHAWFYKKRSDEDIPETAWWTIQKPESGSVFYVVGHL
jgi:hypothetical protein